MLFASEVHVGKTLMKNIENSAILVTVGARLTIAIPDSKAGTGIYIDVSLDNIKSTSIQGKALSPPSQTLSYFLTIRLSGSSEACHMNGRINNNKSVALVFEREDDAKAVASLLPQQASDGLQPGQASLPQRTSVPQGMTNNGMTRQPTQESSDVMQIESPAPSRIVQESTPVSQPLIPVAEQDEVLPSARLPQFTEYREKDTARPKSSAHQVQSTKIPEADDDDMADGDIIDAGVAHLGMAYPGMADLGLAETDVGMAGTNINPFADGTRGKEDNHTDRHEPSLSPNIAERLDEEECRLIGLAGRQSKRLAKLKVKLRNVRKVRRDAQSNSGARPTISIRRLTGGGAVKKPGVEIQLNVAPEPTPQRRDEASDAEMTDAKPQHTQAANGLPTEQPSYDFSTSSSPPHLTFGVKRRRPGADDDDDDDPAKKLKRESTSPESIPWDSPSPPPNKCPRPILKPHRWQTSTTPRTRCSRGVPQTRPLELGGSSSPPPLGPVNVKRKSMYDDDDPDKPVFEPLPCPKRPRRYYRLP